ncbi:MAG: repair protein RecO [Pseudomonadota bacterium]|jgi:DNA repair protein RecO (recombination protein O)
MNRGRRVELSPAFVLHHRPWRDTSRMLEVFSRDHGRLTLFARGARGPKSRLASVLRPFEPLLISWSGRGDAAQLTQAELDVEARGAGAALPATALMPAWYLNELLLKLTLRNDPQPAVYALYAATLAGLRDAVALETTLRRFEIRFLELLGYGVDFASDARAGEPLRADAYYHFHPGLGFVRINGGEGGDAHPGALLLEIAADRLDAPAVRDEARRVLRAALAASLEGRELRTRAVARALGRRGTSRSNGDRQT